MKKSGEDIGVQTRPKARPNVAVGWGLERILRSLDWSGGWFAFERGSGLRLMLRPEASDRIPFDRVLIFEASGRSLGQSQFLDFSWFWEELWFLDLFDFVIHHVYTASIGIKAKVRCIITPFLNPIGKFSSISKPTINSNSSCWNWSGNVSLPHQIYSFQIP